MDINNCDELDLPWKFVITCIQLSPMMHELDYQNLYSLLISRLTKFVLINLYTGRRQKIVQGKFHFAFYVLGFSFFMIYF